jgi:hypothetical protein
LGLVCRVLHVPGVTAGARVSLLGLDGSDSDWASVLELTNPDNFAFLSAGTDRATAPRVRSRAHERTSTCTLPHAPARRHTCANLNAQTQPHMQARALRQCRPDAHTPLLASSGSGGHGRQGPAARPRLLRPRCQTVAGTCYLQQPNPSHPNPSHPKSCHHDSDGTV